MLRCITIACQSGPTDTCVCIYDSDLVEAFTSSSACLPEYEFVQENFVPVNEHSTVAALNQRRSTLSPQKAISELEKALASSTVFDSIKVGMYSKFHENAVYRHGLDDPKTLRLAHMYVILSSLNQIGILTLNQGSTIFWTLGRQVCKSKRRSIARTRRHLICRRPNVWSQPRSLGLTSQIKNQSSAK